MAVRVGLTDGVQQLGASTDDTVVHNQTNRTAISAFNIYNSTANNVELTVYDSPDDTSASGEERANFTIGPKGFADDALDVNEVIGQGYAANTRIIVVVNTAGIVAGDLTTKLTYTVYTGNS